MMVRQIMQAGALLLILGGHAQAKSLAANTATPAAVPAFRLPGRGAEVASDSLRGRVVVVDFWASWCEPCRKSFPWLALLQQKYGERGLTIVAINLDKQRAPADVFLARYPAPFVIAFDPAGKTAAAYKVGGMPTTVLLGRDGTFISRHVGFDPERAEKFEAQIEEALSR